MVIAQVSSGLVHIVITDLSERGGGQHEQSPSSFFSGLNRIPTAAGPIQAAEVTYNMFFLKKVFREVYIYNGSHV